jgi:hypothetical protein
MQVAIFVLKLRVLGRPWPGWSLSDKPFTEKRKERDKE